MSTTSLSQSPLWRWSSQFYERVSTDAWARSLVPWRLTNSVRVAEAYARMVTAWRTDLVASGHKAADAPIEVLELGGGSGRLAFHLVRWLEAAKVPFQLTWSDAAGSSVEAFAGRPFVRARAGVVEAMTLDACRESLGPPLAPDVVIANYVFDSLPHDAWALRSGKLFEQQVRV
ncbi:MAG: class I SAM-dependent methyltransferase, partial [Archangiaceae bacterium]|nr:class I SAM-dependent methyltransferase [Archangiaceae bacterium]